MEMKLDGGDYSPDGLGGLEQYSDVEALLQRVHYRLTARRGAFPLLPDMGSNLHLLLREKPSKWQSTAEYYVQQALSDEDVTISSVELSQSGDQLQLTVELEWEDTTLTVTEEL